MPNNKQHLRAPSFRGTNKLKFTANEQALIKEAERAYGYRSQPPPGMTLGRALGRLFWAAIAAALLGSLVVALSAHPGGAPSPLFNIQTEVLAAAAQTQYQAVVSNTPATQETIGAEGQLPAETSTPSGVLIETDGGIEFRRDQRWKEVEAEGQTLLFAEPRFDAQVLLDIAPEILYFASDTRHSCNEVEGFLTWKIATIRWESESFRGFVCTPEQPVKGESEETQASDGDE